MAKATSPKVNVDVLTLNFMRDKEVFADAFNLRLFGGDPVIRSENLTELDTTMFHIGHGRGIPGISLKKQRDILRKCLIYYDERNIYCILGVENQYVLDIMMPIRALIYDALAYYRQILDAQAEAKKQKSEGKSVDIDIITKVPKDFRLMPVILLVCNFGPTPWSVPTHLHEMLTHVPTDILRYVPDHFYLLLDFHTLSRQERRKLRSELQLCADCFRLRKDRKQLNNLIKNDSRIADISLAAAELLNGILNMRLNLDKTKERVNMCQAMDELLAQRENEGQRKGRKEGRKEGRKAGIKEGEKRARHEGVINLLKLGVLSRTAIAKAMHVSYSTVKTLADSLTAQPT